MNNTIEELYKKLEAQDKIINDQALEIARLKEEYVLLQNASDEEEDKLQQAKDNLQNDYQEAVDKITDLQQENKQLKSILTELEEWLKEEKDYYYENYYYSDFNAYGSKLSDVLDKIQELKEKYK